MERVKKRFVMIDTSTGSVYGYKPTRAACIRQINEDFPNLGRGELPKHGRRNVNEVDKMPFPIQIIEVRE